MSGFKFSLVPQDVPKINTKFRRINTPIPVPESLTMLTALDNYESRSMHGQMPVVWDRAEGFQVSDAWGNKWIDFTSTIFVTNTGHGNHRIIKALKEVLEKPLLHTYTYCSKERVEYIKYLIEKTPKQFEKAFLLSAGTEATECALKLMRMYGQKKGKRKPGIITFEGNWHGRTMGAQMMSYNPAQKEWIGYLDPNIYHLPFPYPWRKDCLKNPEGFFLEGMETLLKEKNLSPNTDLCGFMLETFQGWGAVFYPKEFVQAIQKFAREHDILLAFDEMQAGFGRTGSLFGYMHYDVEPDILCCGKGASSSLPLSIVLGSSEIMDLPEIGSMSSTHSANPMVCAAGKANLESLFEDGLIENSRVLGKLFHEKLNRTAKLFPDYIGQVLGKGLLAAVHFNSPQGEPLIELCDKICETAMRRGLLVVHTGRETIKLAPPLTIHREALFEGLSVFEQSINDCVVGKTL
ncbi:MAG: aminotransferase class III [Nitrospirae bacterium GWB2_47_37]|nr:MAG: aminotransferase class III [Nitrospirae bacterium GWB2_47_37]HAK89665.1 aspartate aminotransferase family protein [Nitrospiraceae bacterium]